VEMIEDLILAEYILRASNTIVESLLVFRRHISVDYIFLGGIKSNYISVKRCMHL